MKKILAILFMFCQFSFFVEALDKIDKTDEFEEAIETLDELDKTDEIIKSKSFYEIEYGDIFFEIGSLLCNEANPMIGIGFESKHENSYTIYQNCFDLVYYKNIFDLMWTPSVFLGNPIVKIGTGIPLGIGVYTYEDIFNPSISIGIRPSVKLTIYNISFELFYQCLMKVFISCDAVKSNEFGLIIKIGTCTGLDDFLR